ncbi:MAG: tRNA1(Val) (adenine(37)-N6)-methyltransferase [Thermodesulfobacteriota bacterium]
MEKSKGPGVSTRAKSRVEAIGPYSFRQAPGGQRLTDDSVLVADFALPLTAADSVIDLGTAAGAIPLMLAWKSPAARIVGVEVTGGPARTARRNVAENGLAERVEIIEGDWRGVRDIFAPGSFTSVVSNPPYRRAGSSRPSPDPARAAARSEVYGTLADLLDAAAYLLAPEGKASFVFTVERSSEMTAGLRQRGLQPVRLEYVRSKPDAPARVFLVEARRGYRLPVTCYRLSDNG